MAAALRTEPVAIGSWTARGMSGPQPRPDKFAPAEARGVLAILENVGLEITHRDELEGGAGLGESTVKHLVRTGETLDRQRARGDDLWKVSSAVKECARILLGLARYCLDEGDWTNATKIRLLELTPDLEEPLAKLEDASTKMRAEEKYSTRQEAVKETDRALAAARSIGAIIELHYRRVPDEAKIPRLGWRLPSRSFRTKAVEKAVESYDLEVGRWFTFAFASASSTLPRQSQLNEISAQLDASKQVQACERQRARCQQLAVADTIERDAAGQAVNGLRDHLSELERAIFEAVPKP